MEDRQTAVEWLYERLERMIPRTAIYDMDKREFIKQAKQMEREQIGYTEEQVYQFWKAGQKYWETSGSSITFEELIEQYQNKTYNIIK
jgi:hypothetical protein